MYDNWLKAAPLPDPSLRGYQLGKHLSNNARKLPVAIIGLDESIANKTREHLYATAYNFEGLRIADLGNIRKQTTEFVIPLLRELHTSNITPILLGGSDELFVSQYLAFNEINRQVSLLAVDGRIDLSADGEHGRSLDPAVHRKGSRYFHLTHIGSQQHLVDPALWRLFDGSNYEAIGLGAARADVMELEPQIRDADLIGINIRALNHLDAPARPEPQPSGFDLQELSQLAYYAGNSDKLSSFGVFGMSPDPRRPVATELTAASYAQLVWYFLQGFSRRANDFPVDKKEMTAYVVDLDEGNRLTFRKSTATNRWWCEIPNPRIEGSDRHKLIACSYQDYVKATTDHVLPDRLLMAFRRFG